MTRSEFFRRVAASIALMMLTAAPATAQILAPIPWVGATGAWTDANNWENGFIPQFDLDEIGLINNGGTALVEGVPPPSPGGLLLGVGAGESGALEVRSGGSISFQSLFEAQGNVVVGQAGTGTLTVRRGGTLVAELLSSGGQQASSIVLGETGGAGTATVTIHGSANLGRTTRVIGPNVDFAAGSLAQTGTLVAEITGTNHSPLTTSGTANLGGNLVLEFNGHTPAAGQTWDVIDAAMIEGKFASVSANASPGPGLNFVVQNVPGGSNGQVARVGIDVQLVLTVHRRSGATVIENLTGERSLTIDGYAIVSPSATLDDSAWEMFSEGGPWRGNGSATHLTEVSYTGSREVGPGTRIEMGDLYAFEPTQLGEALEDVVFDYHVAGGGTVAGLVDFTGPHNNLVLVVDENEGVFIQNQSQQDLSVDGYAILSEGGSLDPSGWTSLANGDPNWTEAAPARNHISELNRPADRFFEAFDAQGSQAVSLGPIFTPGATRDLEFFYHLAGIGTFSGVVEYDDGVQGPSGMPSNPADFNQDGRVDDTDYQTWQAGFGEFNDGSATPADGDSNGDGVVGGQDFLSWQSQFGFATGGTTAAATAVPEPAAMLLLVLVLSVAGCSRIERT